MGDRLTLKTLESTRELEKFQNQSDVPVVNPSALFTIPNDASGSTRLVKGGWVEKYISRPCVLVMDSPPVGAVLRAVPSGNLEKLDSSFRGSFQALYGVLKIPVPGKWAFRYTGTGTLTVIQFDDVGDVAEFEARRALDSGADILAVTSTFVSVGVASTTILAANTARKDAIIVNDSANVIYIKRGTGAALNSGIRLNANGGSYEMSKKLGNLWTGAITGICSVAAQNVTVEEGT